MNYKKIVKEKKELGTNSMLKIVLKELKEIKCMIKKITFDA